MTATWWSNSTGNWAQFATNTSFASGTNITQTNTNFTNPSTTYYWSINVTDGCNWTNSTYHFTTNQHPTQTGEAPTNESTEININPALYVICTDADSDTMTAQWWYNDTTTEQWYQFATNNSINSGTNITQTNTNFSNYTTTYYWSVNLTDGCNWTNATYYFTTKINTELPTVTTNDSTGVEEMNATIWGYLTDDGNATTTCGFWYDTVSGGQTNNVTNGTVAENNIFSYNITGLTPGQLYYFKAWANNSAGFSSASNEKTLLTKPNATQAGSFIAQTNSSSKIYLSWNPGDGANTTYIERNSTAVSSWAWGEGTIIYNGSATNFEDTGLTPATTYYYQAWSYSEWTYNPTLHQFSDSNLSQSNKTKNKPILSNENPENQSIGISLNPTLSIQVNHSDGLQMNITWYWGTDSSCTNLIGYNVSANNGTYSQPDTGSNFSLNSQTYYWKVVVNDTQNEWTNETYHFTTMGHNKMIIDKGQSAYSLQFHPDGTDIYGYINGNAVTSNIDTEWHYVVLTYDGANIKLYKDGALVDSKEHSDPIQTNELHLNLAEYLTGTIDEVRISNIARSAAWINTTYQNTNNPATFATFGTQLGVLTTWTYRKQILINASMIDNDLTNFPILISTTDLDLKNNALTSANDIIFTASSVDWTTSSYTDRFAHEVELYESSTGKIVAWVNITQVSSTTNTSIYMYYGNNLCTSNRENAADVWDSNFISVWHLNETCTDSGTHYDSTSNNHILTFHGETSNASTVGIANGADTLDSENNEYMSANHHNDYNLSGFTIECWVTLDDKSNQRFMIDKASDAGDRNYGLYINADGGEPTLCFQNSSDEEISVKGSTDFSSSGFHFVAGTNDGSTLTLYVNGSSEGSPATGTFNPYTNTHELRVGADDIDTPDYWNGIMDEVRISKIARNSSWINATYHTIAYPTLFLDFGNQEIKNVAPTQSNPSPANNATGQNLNPTLSIQVNDTNNDAMNVTFRTNASGSWETIGTNSSVYNGTYSQIPSNMDSQNTTYYWSVNVTDGQLWSNKTYYFRTVSILTLRPNAVGRSNQLTPYPLDTEHWLYVDDNPWNGDTDYVFTTNQASWINDSYNLTDPPDYNDEIIKIIIYLSGKYDGLEGAGATNQIKPVIYDNISGEWYDSDTAKDLTNSYVNYSWTHTTNPTTGQTWKWDEISNLEVGVALIGEAYQYSRCTQVYVEIYYNT